MSGGLSQVEGDSVHVQPYMAYGGVSIHLCVCLLPDFLLTQRKIVRLKGFSQCIDMIAIPVCNSQNLQIYFVVETWQDLVTWKPVANNLDCKQFIVICLATIQMCMYVN